MPLLSERDEEAYASLGYVGAPACASFGLLASLVGFPPNRYAVLRHNAGLDPGRVHDAAIDFSLNHLNHNQRRTTNMNKLNSLIKVAMAATGIAACAAQARAG